MKIFTQCRQQSPPLLTGPEQNLYELSLCTWGQLDLRMQALIQTAHEQQLLKNLDRLAAMSTAGDTPETARSTEDLEADLMHMRRQHETLQELLRKIETLAPQLSCMIRPSMARFIPAQAGNSGSTECI